MAGVTRLELAASAVTGRRSNQLSYTPAVSRELLLIEASHDDKQKFLENAEFL